jgi:hypothetical protein
MYFTKNNKCEECKLPFNTVWNCKKNLEEKFWILLCYNCIRKFKFLNGWKFKSQLQNIKNFRRCGLRPVEKALPLYEFNQSNAI